MPTYSIVDSDAPDEGGNCNRGGIRECHSGSVRCRRDLSVGRGPGGGTPYNGLYRKGLPERGTVPF